MFGPSGHLSAQMLVHILLMNAIAPLLVLVAGALWRTFPRIPRPRERVRSHVFSAMTVQLATRWVWHAPRVLEATMQSHWLHFAMQATLLLSAIWFWTAVLSVGEAQRWRAVLALLVTSKLFCLLGVLLAFAPRTLYSGMPGNSELSSTVAMLADQQLAGLLMLVACPLAYLTCGVVIAARWLERLDRGEPQAEHRQVARHAV
jgi:putative membrane protein